MADIVRCARGFGLTSKVVTPLPGRLGYVPLPGIAVMKDGTFVVLCNVAADNALVHEPNSPAPTVMPRDAFMAGWSGTLILMTRRARIAERAPRFDLGWIPDAVHTYRRLLCEVLVAVVLTLLVALVGPPFFQAVTDTFQVHYAVTPFYVLIVGVLAIAVFETVGILRSSLFAPPARRIDDELDTRRFTQRLARSRALIGTRQRMGPPLPRLAQIWQDLSQTGSSLARVGDVVHAPTAPALRRSNRLSLPAIRGEIRCEHVNFRYRPHNSLVLDNVSFVIPAGQVVGIVGASGSGKSTLAKLMQRHHVPETGRIVVDGIDIGLNDRAWLQRHTRVVLQEAVHAHRTMRDNIARAEPGAPMSRIRAAAQLAGAHDFILKLPRGYDTLVGGRNGKLSGRQRLRIALACALLTNPRILIFDDAAAACVCACTDLLREEMADITKGRTVLILARNRSAVQGADRILSLEHGRLVQDTPAF